MTLPTARALCEVVDVTWPAASKILLHGATIRDGQGGGSRVSAATTDTVLTDPALQEAEAAMLAFGQTPKFMVRPGDDALDVRLAKANYAIQDETCLYAAPIDEIAAMKPPPVTVFQVWPPLQSQIEIWAAGGIGLERIAIMRRATCRKASFLGRANDRPAGTVYAGIHDGIAMLHALEISAQDRRQGLGAHMTRAVAVWAQKYRATHLTLAATRANTAAHALYTSLGMRVVGQYHYRTKPDA